MRSRKGKYNQADADIVLQDLGSLFLAAMAAQKQNRKVSLFLSLTVLAISNFINVLTVFALLLLLGVKIDVLGIFSENRTIRNITIDLVFCA